jgi:hypothetical protein
MVDRFTDEDLDGVLNIPVEDEIPDDSGIVVDLEDNEDGEWWDDELDEIADEEPEGPGEPVDESEIDAILAEEEGR